MKKNINSPTTKRKKIKQSGTPSEKSFTAASAGDNEKSVGSSKAFEATENPQEEVHKELSDEQLDEILNIKSKL